MSLFSDLEKAILKVLENARYIEGCYTYEVNDNTLYELQEEFNIYFREPHQEQIKTISPP